MLTGDGRPQSRRRRAPASTATTVDAHKAKTSPFSYNVDIFPLLRDNCGRCHVEGGPAPMSLMTYDKDGGAIAWAESIREMLLAGAMPPWYADPTGPAVRNNHALTPRELDKIITWATAARRMAISSMKLPERRAAHWTGRVASPTPNCRCRRRTPWRPA